MGRNTEKKFFQNHFATANKDLLHSCPLTEEKRSGELKPAKRGGKAMLDFITGTALLRQL